MPALKLLIRSEAVGWTKAPNPLFDRLLPTVKDTELRVLLVILRHTTGWNREGRLVSLSYRQLQARTGRQSEAIAAALKSLEKRGLILIAGKNWAFDRFGNPSSVLRKAKQ